MAHKGTWRWLMRELTLIWSFAYPILKLSTFIFVMLVLAVPNPGFADPAVDGLDSKVTDAAGRAVERADISDMSAQTSCDCDCNTWQQIPAISTCQRECDPQWQAWQCGPYLVTGIGPLDAETQRYQAELSQLGLDQNEIMSMVYGFKIAEANLRAEIWDQLEQQKIQHAETNTLQVIADIEAENAQRSSDYDAETLRYKSTLQQADYSQTEVDGLTEIFAPAPQVVRQVYWKEVKTRPTINSD